jgi:uncharacterized protein (TIGR00730 family)
MLQMSILWKSSLNFLGAFDTIGNNMPSFFKNILQVVDHHTDANVNVSDSVSITTDTEECNVSDNKKICEAFTRREVRVELENRYDRINAEVRNGIDFVSTLPKSVTFFGSARLHPSHPAYKKAFSLSKKIASEGYAVITGGGPGIMEAANCGASSVENGGLSVGFNIKLPYEQKLNSCTHESLDFHYFFSRKLSLTFSSEAYIYFPGGYGTLDEFYEIITLIQTQKIEKVPLILVGKDFWQPYDALHKYHLLKTYNTIDPIDTSLYTITDDEDEILHIVKNAPLRDE